MNWSDIEVKRALTGLSRAEMCRRAGISESTVSKGLAKAGKPSNPVREQLLRVLDVALQQKQAAA